MPGPPPVPPRRVVRTQFHLLWVMVALLAAVVGFGSYWFSHSLLADEVESRLNALAMSKSRHLAGWLGECADDLRVVSDIGTLQQMLAGRDRNPGRTRDSLALVLTRIRNAFGRRYDGISIYGPDSLLWGGPAPAAGPDPDQLGRVLDGKVAAAFDWRQQSGSSAHLQIYVPLAGLDARPVGVLVGALSDRELSMLLEIMPHHSSERVCLVDSTGVVLNPEGRLSAGCSRAREIPAIVQAARLGGTGVKRYQDDHGIELLGACEWIAPLGWGILAERELDEAFGLLYKWRLAIWTAVLLVTGAAVGLGVILWNRLAMALEQREAELWTTHEQLITADRLASVGMMAASVAHEVNNPLATIKVLIDSTREQMPATDPRRPDLEIVRTEIDKIKALILRLLQFAKPREPELASVQLQEILTRLVDLIRPQAQIQNVRLVEHYEALPPIWADGSQLGQAFLNILLNAVEATPSGGEIRVGTQPIGHERVAVTIWNSGQGLDPQLEERVFEPFFTTKASGTGLGLSIARMIVDRHRGTVRAIGHGSQGTTFRITLPMEPEGKSHVSRPGG